MVGLDGVIAMETNDAAVTLSEVEPDILPDVAVIVVDPALPAVASPFVAAALLTAATAEADEFHVTVAVRF